METLSPEVIEDFATAAHLANANLRFAPPARNLSPADRAEILAVLAEDPDEVISTERGRRLLSDSPRNFRGSAEARKRRSHNFSPTPPKICRQTRHRRSHDPQQKLRRPNTWCPWCRISPPRSSPPYGRTGPHHFPCRRTPWKTPPTSPPIRKKFCRNSFRRTA